MDRQADLPFVTPEIDALGGTVRTEPSDFVVEEIPLYEPKDDGQHVYVRLTREGRTTREVVDGLADLFDVPASTIGYAGLKDREARARQTFSLDSAKFDRPKPNDEEVGDRIEEALDVEVEYARRHRNKLRRGHLIGNRFRIAVREPDSDAFTERVEKIAEAIVERGLPNFYGAQRFGADGENAERGRRIIAGEDFAGPGWKRRLLCNAYQSELFNRWLCERIERDGFDRLLEGDIAKKVDTGGLFEVERLDEEQPRFERRDITFTGPIYGGDLWEATGPAGELEGEILASTDFDLADFDRSGLSSSRRRGRIHVDEIGVEAGDARYTLRFELPKGAYATTVLREFL
jgi:tRNA pseudouridine13 synthase